MRARRLASSMINRIVFDDDAETLNVTFRGSGRRYTYLGVPRAIFDGLAHAASAGRFFNEYVKGRFACIPDRKRYPLT